MLEGTEKHREYTDKGVTVSLEAGNVRFEVQESFKGVSTPEVTVLADNMKGTSCEGMAALARGKTYLVYAGVEMSGELSIGPCSPTKPIDNAKVDLEFLRALPQPGSGGRLYGSIGVEIGAGEPTPLPNVTVVIEDEADKRIGVKTDSDGNFEAGGLKPGKYKVTPSLPEKYVARDRYHQSRVVEVFDRGCSRAPFLVNVNGGFEGKLNDSGRLVPAYLRQVDVVWPPTPPNQQGKTPKRPSKP
jgi:hypothetical protein